MLKAGRALLLLEGYVPDDGAQHKTVVDVVSAVLGKEYENLTNQFDRMRRKRNEMTYEAGALISQSESQKAFSDSILLIRQVLSEVKLKNPQLKLKLEFKQNNICK